MMEEKSRDSQLEDGVIVLDSKTMDHEKYCKIIDDTLHKLYIKAKSNDIDVRGLLVLGLIYCQGTEEEKRDALS